MLHSMKIFLFRKIFQKLDIKRVRVASPRDEFSDSSLSPQLKAQEASPSPFFPAIREEYHIQRSIDIPIIYLSYKLKKGKSEKRLRDIDDVN